MSLRDYISESRLRGVSRRLGVQPPKNARVCLSYVKSQEDASQHSTVLVERKRRNSFGNYLAGPRTLMSDLEQPAHESADSIETLEEEAITVDKLEAEIDSWEAEFAMDLEAESENTH